MALEAQDALFCFGNGASQWAGCKEGIQPTKWKEGHALPPSFYLFLHSLFHVFSSFTNIYSKYCLWELRFNSWPKIGGLVEESNTWTGNTKKSQSSPGDTQGSMDESLLCQFAAKERAPNFYLLIFIDKLWLLHEQVCRPYSYLLFLLPHFHTIFQIQGWSLGVKIPNSSNISFPKTDMPINGTNDCVPHKSASALATSAASLLSHRAIAKMKWYCYTLQVSRCYTSIGPSFMSLEAMAIRGPPPQQRTGAVDRGRIWASDQQGTYY